MTLAITSTAFAHNAAIPKQYTCEGKDTSPPLAWSGVPSNAKSLALIVDDPDAPDPAAPKMTWVHWVLYNLPPSATGLAEGVAPRRCRRERCKGRMTGSVPATAARARPSASIAISTSSTPSIPCYPI